MVRSWTAALAVRSPASGYSRGGESEFFWWKRIPDGGVCDEGKVPGKLPLGLTVAVGPSHHQAGGGA